LSEGGSGKRETDYRVIKAQEDERKRLARDLHDSLVQSLVGIGISLEVVERHVTSDPIRKPEALELVSRLREGLAGCLEEARRILSDLRPLDLSGRSLAEALKDYAERVSGEAGLKVLVVISGQETRLHPALEAGLFRIFQEALNNIREHAAAREVSLKLRFLPRSVAMDVADDGQGFPFDGDYEELARRRCFGLVGINERVRLLGGTWRVSARPGQGTEVRVRLPVEARSGIWSLLPSLGAAGHEAAADRGGDEPVAGRRARRSRPGGSPDPAPKAALRVLLADDHRVVREGLRMIFDIVQGIEVVGEAQDGDQAIRLCRELSPDVVLMDLVMPGPGAVAVLREIERTCPRTAVVVLTAYHEPDQVRGLLEAGAAGYLLKTAGTDEITGAVRAAASGLRPLASEAVRALSEGGRPAGVAAPGPAPAPAADGVGGLEELTLRERELLALVGEGLANREISRRLFISEKTTRNHIGAIIRKLGLVDRTQVALVARGFHPAGRRREG